MTKTSSALQQIRLLDIFNLKSAGEGLAYYQPSPSSEAGCLVASLFVSGCLVASLVSSLLSLVSGLLVLAFGSRVLTKSISEIDY
jgi:hypothetical protein